MVFVTPEQFVLLGAVLLGGLLIGFAVAPSPGKWKRRVGEQSSSFTAYHHDAEDRLRAANQRARDLKAEAEALRADHAEAERTIAALRAAAATAPALVAGAETPDLPRATEPFDATPNTSPTTSTGAASATSAAGVAPAARDDLTRLHGVDSVLATRLFGLGVTRFEDIEKLSAEDEMALEQRLSLPVGYLAREQWRIQAALLRSGQFDHHGRQFGKSEQMPPI